MNDYNTITGKRNFLAETIGAETVKAMSDVEVVTACCQSLKALYSAEEAKRTKEEYNKRLDRLFGLVKPEKPKTLRDKLGSCECVCYFFFGEDDKLLYVGKANDFYIRWTEHKKLKDISKIKRLEFHVFHSLPDVVFYEAQMILALRPLWNKKDTKGTMSSITIAPAEIIHAKVEEVI